MSAEQTKTESPVVDNTTSEPVVESTTHNTTEPVSSEPVITEHTNEGDATTAQDDKPEEKKDDTSKPTPSPSKSGTKRLSLFLSKAKKTLVPDKDEKKSPSENKSLPEEPIVEQEEQQPATEQVPAEETTTPIDTEPTTSEDKQEKRKSNFLNGFFKKVTTPTKEEKDKEIKTDDKPEAEADVTPKEDAPAPAIEEQQETTTPEESVDADLSAPAVPPAKNKENVVDQIKRHSLVNKWFGKKEKAPKEEEPTSDVAPVLPEPIATEPITTEQEAPVEQQQEEPTTSNDVVDAPQETGVKEEEDIKQSTQEKPARSGSPLGRKLTQMLRGFPKKEKKPVKEEEAKVEEDQPKEDQPKETVTEDQPKETATEEPKMESPAVSAPTVQATA